MKEEILYEYEKLEKGHAWHIARRKIVKHALRQHFKKSIHPRPTLLDVGCGPGITLSHFAKMYDCVGIEPNPFFIEKARKNSNAMIVAGGLPDNLPVFSHKFDIIFLLDVLEHIENDLAGLAAIREILNEKGIIIINVPALPFLWSIHDEFNEHKRRYTRSSICNLATQAHLNVKQVTYWANTLVPFFVFERVLFDKHTSKNRYDIPAPLINNAIQSWLYFEYKFFRNLRVPFGLSLLLVLSH